LRIRDTDHLRELEEILSILRRQEDAFPPEVRDKLFESLEQVRDDLKRGLNL